MPGMVLSLWYKRILILSQGCHQQERARSSWRLHAAKLGTPCKYVLLLPYKQPEFTCTPGGMGSKGVRLNYKGGKNSKSFEINFICGSGSVGGIYNLLSYHIHRVNPHSLMRTPPDTTYFQWRPALLVARVDFLEVVSSL